MSKMNRPLLFAVSKVLQRKGFSVIQASDGSSALEWLCEHEDRIDAMLLDVTLPGVSSREVFEAAERLRPDLAVILTSAYGQDVVACLLCRTNSGTLYPQTVSCR